MSDNTNHKSDNECRVVVSMTSFPPAIPYAIGAVKSILNGSVLPDKVILYLTYAQFEGGKLPEDLLRLAEENPLFEIRNFDPDIRSYRKLIPALREFPEAIIVTVDDDVHYHRDMLRDLLEFHKKEPTAVLAHRAKRIAFGKPYRKWRKYRWYDFLFKKVHKGFANLQTGVAGVLYPPHSLREEMLKENLFVKLAPTTDDIWFWAAAVANDTMVIPMPFGKNKPKGLGKPKALSLKKLNFKGEKDRNAEALERILETFPEVKKRIMEYGY